MRTKLKNRKAFKSVFPMITIFGMAIISLSSYSEPEWHFDWKGIRLEVKDTILMVKNNSIAHKYTGYGGIISSQYKRQQWLMNYATESELQKLTEYPNTTVKVIAYEGLLKNPLVKDKTSIVLNVIKDTVSKVYYTMGCIGDRMDLSQYVMKNTVFDNMIYSSGAREFRDVHNFTDSQKKKILAAYYEIQNIELEN